MFDLDGETALVTGASRGLGAQTAQLLAANGADVALNYPTDAERADVREVCESIRESGGTAIPVQADVSSETDVERMFDEIAEEFAVPNVVVNNAGVGAAGEIEDISEAEWDRVVDVDLKGVFLCSREAVRRMDTNADEPGRIVNVASQLAFKGAPELTHYCAAKGGVVSFTRALAREVAPEILVNAVAPGPMGTDMLLDGTSQSWRDEKRSEIPLDRFGEPSEVAPSILFLSAEASNYYTGQVLSPDGGDAMH